MQASFKINTAAFRNTLNEYKNYTKRDLATILNTKAFFIARGAARNTHRANAGKIATEFGKAFKLNTLKSGKFSRNKRGKFVFGAMGRDIEAPLLALIINKQRGRSGKKGLQGAEMEDMMRRVFRARMASIAFLASGFIPSIKGFRPYADYVSKAPPMDKQSKQIGQAKGGFVIAQPGWTPRAVIWNSASAKRDHRAALEKHGGAGLQQATDEEVASMRQYIEQKLQQTANKFNALR